MSPDPDPDAEDSPWPVSRWSARMPRTVPGLAVGIVACLVVIAGCFAVLAWAVGLLVGG